VYVVGSNFLYVIDGTSNKLIDTLEIPDRPTKVAIDSNTNMVYISTWNYPYGGVFVINGTNDAVISNIKDVAGSSYGIAVNPNTNMIYVDDQVYTRFQPNVISVVNGTNNRVVANITTAFSLHAGVSTIPGAFRILDIAVNSSTNMVYAANHWLPIISVIDGSNNRVVANVTIPYYPKAISVNPRTNTVYSVSGNGTVYAVDGLTNKIVSSASLQDSEISEIAVNPNTGKLYAVDGFTKSVYVLDQSAMAVVPEFSIAIPVLAASLLAISALTMLRMKGRNRSFLF
jgi:DNA-binding beta-propeller fold protein YncE